MHDRLIGALETCCRQGEMLRIHNRDVDWTQHQIVIRGTNAKDHENRPDPIRPARSPRADPQATRDVGSAVVRIRFTGRRIPGQLQDRMGRH
jgi:hypothetical protein